MSKKHTTEFIKDLLKKEGFILTSEYVNANTKFNFICPNGHRHSVTWRSWQQGNRCTYCSGKAKLLYEFVKSHFEKDGYIPKFTEYINSSTKLGFICPQGHEHSITWDSWKQGRRCGRCKGNIKLTYEDVKKSFEDDGYTNLEDEYINSATKMGYICPNGHEHSITWANWSNGYRCPKCSWFDGTSKFEQEVKEFIKLKNIYVIENDRTTILNPKTNRYLELDILLPCKTKAIECNGVYWHSFPYSIEKDKIKKDQCKKLGINLLTIEDTVWYNDRKECEKLIKELINGITI